MWEVVDKNINEKSLGGREKYYISKYSSYKLGYNSTTGGEGCCGLKHTDAVKKKISKSSKARNAGKGNPRFGKPVSEETRLKISQSNGSKPFRALDRFAGKTIGRWNIVSECARDLNIKHPGSISRCLKKKRKYYKNYIFIYDDEYGEFDFGLFSAKSVFVVFKNDGFVGEWGNCSQCARDLNLSRKMIKRCLNKEKDQCDGYTFKYKEE